ncbi:MAG: cupredoxin domain-containing protein [Chloroflexota bacterium]
MAWIIYSAAVLIISGVIGLHLGRFREAYTEMTGMMAGMTMGMLNGFVLGYAAAGLFASMFWGNLFGIILGTALGCYFGRAGGLMGIMDGGMGGVMGGSMGAMLMVMLVWPNFIFWTAVLLGLVYLVGMLGLVALIEQSSPEHAALHRVLPMFTRAVAAEATEAAALASTPERRAPIEDYYSFLGVTSSSTGAEITAAYLHQLSVADGTSVDKAERAISILTDPVRRKAYDARLAQSQAAGDCCPPPRRKRTEAAVSTVSPALAQAVGITAAAYVSNPAAGQSARNKPANESALAARRRTRPDTVRRQKPAQKEAPISWVGGVAAFVIAFMLLGWWLFNQGQALSNAANNGVFTDNGAALPAEFVQKLQTQAVVAPLSTGGTQAIDVVVNGDSMSYKPSVIKVKQGTPVQFRLSVQGRDPGCGRFVGIRGLGAHGIANPGENTTLDFTPTQSGVFQINCNMQMMNPGYLIVTN